MKSIPYCEELRGEQRIVSVHFDSMMELLDCDINEATQNEYNRSRFNKIVHDGEVYETAGWLAPTNKNTKDVINHALLGDEILYNRLRGMVDLIDAEVGKNTTVYRQHVTKVKRIRKHDTFGDELDIHKVYQGKSEIAWERRVRTTSNEEHNLVTILVDIGGVGDDDVIDSLWRAAATLKLVEDYESAGKSIKIIVGSVAMKAFQQRPGVLITQTITVKNYNERLPLQRVAAMCHLGFHRTFSFAGRLSQPDEISFTYGRSIPITEQLMPIELKREIDSGTTKLIIVPRYDSKYGAIATIRKVYDELDRLSKGAA